MLLYGTLWSCESGNSSRVYNRLVIVLLLQIMQIEPFEVDPVGKRLIGDPDHGGKQMIDMF